MELRMLDYIESKKEKLRQATRLDNFDLMGELIEDIKSLEDSLRIMKNDKFFENYK